MTWNVNANQPDSLSKIRDLLIPDSAQLPDLIAVSIQELVKLNVENVVMTGDLSVRAGTKWLGLLTAALKVRSNCFVPLIAKHCVGTFLVIFRNVNSLIDVTDVTVTHVAVGMGIGMGNKAGCAARVVRRALSYNTYISLIRMAMLKCTGTKSR